MTNQDNPSTPLIFDSDRSGFELEDVGNNEEIELQEKPFDPKKVDVSITTPNLGVLIDRLRHNEINLMPDFQRSGDLWSNQMQSRLIESILIRLPIPAFYFDAVSDDTWQVVDGLQRLSAISNFVISKTLKLTNLEFLQQYEDSRYDDLPRALQRRIDEFQTSVYLIKNGTPVIVKYSLFNRINTGGLKLTHQEIRHALSQSVGRGKASKFLSEIVDHDVFKKVVGTNNNRMSYQELVLRHMAFVLFDLSLYKSSLPKFLDSAMIELGHSEDQKLNKLRENFLRAMETAFALFRENAFKKTLADPHMRKIINKPLFEAVSVAIAEISPEACNRLVDRQQQFMSSFMNLLMNQDFLESITKSTANTDNVQKRFTEMKTIVNEFSSEEFHD